MVEGDGGGRGCMLRVLINTTLTSCTFYIPQRINNDGHYCVLDEIILFHFLWYTNYYIRHLNFELVGWCVPLLFVVRYPHVPAPIHFVISPYKIMIACCPSSLLSLSLNVFIHTPCIIPDRKSILPNFLCLSKTIATVVRLNFISKML